VEGGGRGWKGAGGGGGGGGGGVGAGSPPEECNAIGLVYQARAFSRQRNPRDFPRTVRPFPAASSDRCASSRGLMQLARPREALLGENGGRAGRMFRVVRSREECVRVW
jgi:hypothetical protein